MKYVFSFFFLFISFASLGAHSSVDSLEQPTLDEKYKQVEQLFKDAKDVIEYREAMIRMTALFKKGHADAKFWLASMYYGVKAVEEENYSKAIELLKLLAAQGHTKAQKKLRLISADESQQNSLNNFVAQYKKRIELIEKAKTVRDYRAAIEQIIVALNQGRVEARDNLEIQMREGKPANISIALQNYFDFFTTFRRFKRGSKQIQAIESLQMGIKKDDPKDQEGLKDVEKIAKAITSACSTQFRDKAI